MENHRPVKLILVRHGITTWNKDSRYQGQTDVPLSDEGETQADLAGKRLKGYEIDRIFSSDLSRAFMTAKIIASHCNMEVKPDKRLRELSFGDWEGLTFDEITQKWPDKQQAWLKDPVTLCPPNGETAADLGVRLKAALADIYEELSQVPATDRPPCGVVVAHGGVIRALIAYANTGDMANMWSVGVKQASLTSCMMLKESLTLIDCNDVSHLGTMESPDRLSQKITK